MYLNVDNGRFLYNCNCSCIPLALFSSLKETVDQNPCTAQSIKKHFEMALRLLKSSNFLVKSLQNLHLSSGSKLNRLVAVENGVLLNSTRNTSFFNRCKFSECFDFDISHIFSNDCGF